MPLGEDKVASDFYLFLTGFISEYPEFYDRPLYISGESFGGHYIPSMTEYIATHGSGDDGINLKAALIGNAWVDPHD